MKVRFINRAIFLVAVLVFSAFSAFAQENEPIVVDEVIAQVNDGVITLSRVKREMKEAIDALVQQGKTPAEAKTTVENRQGELIANLINEELLLQKGKELGVEQEVEAQINQRFTQIMKEQNIKTLDALYKEMEKQNVKPDELREGWRTQLIRDAVFQRDVDSKVYYGLSSKEVKEYYEKNKAKFTKPETVTLSEIFLGFAGRDETTVRAKADQLLAQLKSGADFAKVVAENSDRPDAAKTKGKVGTFPMKEVNEKIAAAIKDAKVGSFVKLDIDEGVEIIRLDARENASSESVFDENAVRSAITYEKLPAERKKYLTTLRKDAYIKVSEGYRAMVSPLLFEEERKAETKKASK